MDREQQAVQAYPIVKLVAAAQIDHPDLHLIPGMGQGRRHGDGYHRAGCPAAPDLIPLGAEREGRGDPDLPAWRECRACGVCPADVVHIGPDLRAQIPQLCDIAGIAFPARSHADRLRDRLRDGGLPDACVACAIDLAQSGLRELGRRIQVLTSAGVRRSLEAWHEAIARDLTQIASVSFDQEAELRRVSQVLAGRPHAGDVTLPERTAPSGRVLLFLRLGGRHLWSVPSQWEAFHSACHHLARVAGLVHAADHGDLEPAGSCAHAVMAPPGLAARICDIAGRFGGVAAEVAGPVPQEADRVLIADVAVKAWTQGVPAADALRAARAAARPA
ncbi:hypothetical protein D5H75_37710 [Bailinhaonella thermotolerans]|uniref:Uncharacterized protein n=2 Tax=Bailinhaonella thermotolerans TaxID=1070861 RepID=A0A3A4A664_9ACTN|nr:hypothetical protein D5H75_37710 [Bailinhaonella thermotolerans]